MTVTPAALTITAANAYKGVVAPLALASAPNGAITFKGINNNKTPFGGPVSCPWINANSQCGPNDEIFSFHGNGANVVFAEQRAKRSDAVTGLLAVLLDGSRVPA